MGQGQSWIARRLGVEGFKTTDALCGTVICVCFEKVEDLHHWSLDVAVMKVMSHINMHRRAVTMSWSISAQRKIALRWDLNAWLMTCCGYFCKATPPSLLTLGSSNRLHVTLCTYVT